MTTVAAGQEYGSVAARVDQLTPYGDTERSLYACAFGMIQVIGENQDMPGSLRVRLARNVLTAAEQVRNSDVPAEPAPEPAAGAKHEISTGWKGDGPGECGVACTCGVTYDGFDSLAEAEQHLLRHIADPAGQDYGRADTAEADDPTPVSGGRIEPHTGAVTDSSLVPKPIAEHYDASEFAGDAICACGESFGGLGALDRLAQHVAKANAVTDGGLVDETEARRTSNLQYFEDGRSNAECSEEELEGR
jgi:hypothetical protein